MTDRSIIKKQDLFFYRKQYNFMSPKTEEQFSEIRKERREQIMQVALELFAHDGYHSTSIASIARKAGISKGLMYNYFESKEALLKELIITTSNKVHVELDPDHDGKVSPVEFLRFIRVTLKNIRENVTYWRLYSTLSLQKEVMDIIMNEMQDLAKDTMQLLTSFFVEHFAGKAEEELYHLSALFKGVMLQFLSINDEKWMKKNEEMMINYYKDKKGWTEQNI